MAKTRAERKAELMAEIEREIDSLLAWEDQTTRVTITDIEDKVLASRQRITEQLSTELTQLRAERLEGQETAKAVSKERLRRKGKKTGRAKRE